MSILNLHPTVSIHATIRRGRGNKYIISRLLLCGSDVSTSQVGILGVDGADSAHGVGGVGFRA